VCASHCVPALPWAQLCAQLSRQQALLVFWHCAQLEQPVLQRSRSGCCTRSRRGSTRRGRRPLARLRRRPRPRTPRSMPRSTPRGTPRSTPRGSRPAHRLRVRCSLTAQLNADTCAAVPVL